MSKVAGEGIVLWLVVDVEKNELGVVKRCLVYISSTPSLRNAL
jgi:hypothetical protein